MFRNPLFEFGYACQPGSCEQGSEWARCSLLEAACKVPFEEKRISSEEDNRIRGPLLIICMNVLLIVFQE